MASVQNLQHPALDRLSVDFATPAKPESKNKDLAKTKLCTFFLQGSCTLGATCKFAHHASEMRAAPNLAKTQLCTKYMNGRCFNLDCSYAHGETELVKPPSFKKKMCSWHKDGKCRNGAKCGFAHSVSELCAEAQQAYTKENLSPPGLAAPWQKGSLKGDDCDASTRVPSSPSLAESDISSLLGSRSVPEEHLFRMMAGRGSAPVHQQVASMTLAINDLQEKLAKVEETAMQTQVVQMKQTIEQLSEQCEDMEARMRTQQQQQQHQKSARSMAPPPVAQPTKTLPARQDRVRVASTPRKYSNKDDETTGKVRSLPGRNIHQTSVLKPSAKPMLRWLDRTGTRAALGVVVLALMVMLELSLKQ